MVSKTFCKRPRKGHGMIPDALQGSDRAQAIRDAIAFLEPVLAVPAVIETRIVGEWPEEDQEPVPKRKRPKRSKTAIPKIKVDLTDWPME